MIHHIAWLEGSVVDGESRVKKHTFMGIGVIAFVYWMLQLKSFSDNNEEDKSISSHSYL